MYTQIYDERTAGKCGDSMISLRLNHILSVVLKQRPIVKHVVSVRDNKVSENKSKVLVKFYAVMSVLWFGTVLDLYMLPGHSHTAADRQHAYISKAVAGRNIFDPEDLVRIINEVKGMNAAYHYGGEGLAHKPYRIFKRNWEDLLNKYFHDPPGGYTKKFFFEYKRGVATIRQTASSTTAWNKVNFAKVSRMELFPPAQM